MKNPSGRLRDKHPEPLSGAETLSRYWTGAHTTHRLRYHFVFVPKYRKRVLKGPITARLEMLLRQACEVQGWNLEELAIQSDHIHFSPAQIVKLLKGGTSRVLRVEFPEPGRIFVGP